MTDLTDLEKRMREKYTRICPLDDEWYVLEVRLGSMWSQYPCGTLCSKGKVENKRDQLSRALAKIVEGEIELFNKYACAKIDELPDAVMKLVGPELKRKAATLRKARDLAEHLSDTNYAAWDEVLIAALAAEIIAETEGL